MTTIIDSIVLVLFGAAPLVLAESGRAHLLPREGGR